MQDPQSVQQKCDELISFFESAHVEPLPQLEAIDFPEPVLDALALALPQVP